MTDNGWLTKESIEASLPHRGANMLLDAVRISGEKEEATSEARLTIDVGDELGRDIFLRDDPVHGKVVLEPTLAEHVALSAIVMMKPDMNDGEIAFFSTISNFKMIRPVKAGEEIHSLVCREGDRGGFFRFKTYVTLADKTEIATAEIMAFAMTPEQPSEERGASKKVAPSEVTEVKQVDKSAFGWKQPAMVFGTERISLAEDNKSVTIKYDYPDNHPFCAGHFPGNPIMMGITLWVAASDAASWLMHERAMQGIVDEGDVKASAEIFREDGTLISDIRGMVLRVERDGDNLAPVQIMKTKRVGFRDQVRGGETIYIRAKIK